MENMEKADISTKVENISEDTITTTIISEDTNRERKEAKDINTEKKDIIIKVTKLRDLKTFTTRKSLARTANSTKTPTTKNITAIMIISTSSSKLIKEEEIKVEVIREENTMTSTANMVSSRKEATTIITVDIRRATENQAIKVIIVISASMEVTKVVTEVVTVMVTEVDMVTINIRYYLLHVFIIWFHFCILLNSLS